MSGDTYTLAEARIELQRLECARGGHAPDRVMRVAGQAVAVAAYCECGYVIWTPKEQQ